MNLSYMLGLLAQVDTSAVQVNSIWDFVVKGGPMMIPIGICSLIALTVFVERVISLRRKNIIPPGFLDGLKKVLADGSNGRSKALDYCKLNKSPVAAVFTTGIKRLSEPLDVLERHIQESGQREIYKMRKFMRVLSVIASITPLMGLLGTIFGMIKAFSTVAASADALGRTETLAGGIYEAMITTAAGLMVAIPVPIAYNYVSARIERMVADIDEMTVDFIEEYAMGGSSGASRATATPAEEPRATDTPPADSDEPPLGAAVATTG